MTVSRVLHHFPLDPASRQARMCLAEKKIAHLERPVRYWEYDETFHRVSPSGRPPVLEVLAPSRQYNVCELPAILDWAETQVSTPPLLPSDPAERAEVFRLRSWFDRKFEAEVEALLLYERMEKRLQGLGSPEARPLREGREALRWHMGYLETILSERDRMVGRILTLADLCVGAHLSVLDYFGEIPWAEFPAAKMWYVKLKSRPSFRPLLSDRLPGFTPVAHYDDLDF